MSEVRVYPIAPKLSLIDLAPPIPGFDEFIGCYVLQEEKIALVDVGPSNCSSNLLKGLDILGISPREIEYIFITHVHIDHAGGIGTLIPHMPQARVIVHERGKPHLINPQRLWEGSRKTLGTLAEGYGPIEPVPPARLLTAEEGTKVELGKQAAIEILFTPGHASHHLSFRDKEGRLFAGEAAGIFTAGTVRPAAPPPFDLKQMMSSLDKLADLNSTLLCYGHFGCASNTTKRIRSYQKQLTLWSKIISAALLEGASNEEIYHELQEQDKNLKPLNSLKKPQQQREQYFLTNAIAGFVEYLRRK